MIVVDASNIFYGHIAMELMRTNSNVVDPDFLRHMILNQLRALNVKFRGDYGRMFLAYDGRNYWRKDLHEHYKANRKTTPKPDEPDWEQIYGVVNAVKEEIRDFLPFPVLEADRAEADDIMGWMAKNCPTPADPLLIISGDKDMRQLLHFKNVNLYRPVQDEMVKERDPIGYLHSMMMSGDDGDGIPNVLSDLDTFVAEPKKRQKPLTQKRKDEIGPTYKIIPAPAQLLSATSPYHERLQLNWNLMSLLDVDSNPVGPAIREAYNHAVANPKQDDTFRYLASKGLRTLVDKVADFVPAKMKTSGTTDVFNV